jgi:ABC-type ATPase with predicted acetyltransferase domain
MQTYHVKLQSDVSKSYRCQRAADSLDIDAKKKSIHELTINADLKTEFSIGLIVGASGSGKTTLAKQMFGQNCFNVVIDVDKPIIDQLPEKLNYDECAEMLSGIGLTSVPCWIRPVKTLSNGQRARAEAVLNMIASNEINVIDEWTSVVDRTVAKVMSYCVQKFARKNKKRLILLSCHYDVMEWLNPDWVIDCNKQEFVDRRLLQSRERKERLNFELREVGTNTWKYFSKYHYLSDRLPGGKIFTFGLFHKSDQIGFQCFANYVPAQKGKTPIFHSNRTVIHPDYAGFGLGIKVINESSQIMKSRGYRVMAKFSSVPIYRSMIKNTAWRLLETKRQIGKMNHGGSMMRRTGYRENIKTFSFEFIGMNSMKAIP